MGKELNSEQIIKALECCVKSECEKCPLRDGRCANGEMGRLSLALIKELTKENERLKARDADIDKRIIAYTVRKMQALIAKESSWLVTMSNGIVTKRTYQITEDALGKIADKIITEVVKNA